MKITLRELFMLTVIVALSLGWWLDRSSLKTKCNKFEVEAFMAWDIAADLAWVLQRDQNYSVDLSDGFSVNPVNGHNGAAFSTSGGVAESRIREMLEKRS